FPGRGRARLDLRPAGGVRAIAGRHQPPRHPARAAGPDRAPARSGRRPPHARPRDGKGRTHRSTGRGRPPEKPRSGPRLGPPAPCDPTRRRTGRRARGHGGGTMMFVRSFPLALLIAVPLFVSAGRWQVPAFAAYVLMHWLSTATIYTLALRRHPGLVAERLKPPSDRDRATRRIAIPLFLAFCI